MTHSRKESRGESRKVGTELGLNYSLYGPGLEPWIEGGSGFPYQPLQNGSAKGSEEED